jgi:DNA-binding MarR family transcriptional regulator
MIVSITDDRNAEMEKRVALGEKKNLAGCGYPGETLTKSTDTGPTPDAEYPECLMACSDFVLGTLSMAVTELVERALEPVGLRLRHYRLLRLLYFEGSRQQSTIGKALGIDRTTVVALVDHLEKLKLAKRVRSPDDRRVYQIAITDKGRRVSEKASETVNAVEANMFSPLTPDEQDLVRKLSARLLQQPGIIADAQAKTPPGSSRA